MEPVKITGHSDDCICIEGGLCDEFNRYEGVCYMHFSEGTILTAEYDDDGIWRINRVREGTATYEHVPGSAEDDTNDVATLIGDLQWVEDWDDDDPSHDNVCEALERLAEEKPWETANLDNKQLLAIWRQLKGHQS